MYGFVLIRIIRTRKFSNRLSPIRVYFESFCLCLFDKHNIMYIIVLLNVICNNDEHILNNTDVINTVVM